MEHLRQLAHTPSVQMHQVPPDAKIPRCVCVVPARLCVHIIPHYCCCSFDGRALLTVSACLHPSMHRYQFDEEEPLEEKLGQYAREHVLLDPIGQGDMW